MYVSGSTFLFMKPNFDMLKKMFGSSKIQNVSCGFRLHELIAGLLLVIFRLYWPNNM